MKIKTVAPCPVCGGFRFENGEARHAEWCTEPDIFVMVPDPIYDGFVPGMGPFLQQREGESTRDFASRLTAVFLKRGQGSGNNGHAL